MYRAFPLLALSLPLTLAWTGCLDATERDDLGHSTRGFDIIASAQPATTVPGYRSGGSAADGFTYEDSNDVDGPEFFWVDISETGTVLDLDSTKGVDVSLSMSFPFYGTDYSTLNIGRNGGIAFDGNYIPSANTGIPGTPNQGVTKLIAAFWDDLYTNAGGHVYYEVRDAAPNRKLIVQWQDVNHAGTSDTLVFQVILFETSGNILMQYLDPSLEAGSLATVGVQGSSAQGVEYSYDQAVIVGGLAICFTPAGGNENGCDLNGQTQSTIQFTDSRQPGAPQFNWQEISDSGTAISLSNNGETTITPTDFSFTFPSTLDEYSSFTIGANGAINFTSGNVAHGNTAIPTSNANSANRFVALYWDNLDPSAGGKVYYKVLSDPERLVIQYNKVPHRNSGDVTDTVTAQIILFEESSNILLQYLNPSTERGSGATVGVQLNATSGVQYSYNDSALSKNLAVCYYPSTGDPADCSVGNWLTKFGPGSVTEAQDYYSNIGAAATLDGWKNANGYSAASVLNAKYYNNFDLGLGRDMNCWENGNDIACYVTNYGIAPGGPANTAINHAISDTNPVATVAMVYDASANTDEEVQFMVYDGNGDRLDQVALDSEGAKNVPHVCLPCHGGSFSNNTVSGASFLPFDVFSYKFSAADSNYTLAAQQEAFRQLNEIVLDTNPTSDIQNIINGWYENTGGVDTVGATAEDDYVPSAWNSDSGVYNKVVKTTCRGCHAAQTNNLGSPSSVQYASGSVCSSKTMPHAEKAFTNFWTDDELHLPSYLAATYTGWSKCLDAEQDSPIPARFSLIDVDTEAELVDAALRTQGTDPQLYYGTFDSATSSAVGQSLVANLHIVGFILGVDGSTYTIDSTIVGESDEQLLTWNWFQSDGSVPDAGSVWTSNGWEDVDSVGLSSAEAFNGKYYYRIQMADRSMGVSAASFMANNQHTMRFFTY